MKISIVVPAFNEEKLIAKTLRSIDAASAAFYRCGWQTEMVVCDNNSTDRTSELARGAGAKVVFEPVNQIGRARNAGAAAASGDWLIFVDADSEPSVALFDDVARSIKAGNVIAGGSTVRLETKHKTALVVTAMWNWISRMKRWFAGSFIFCDAAAFREIGGFNHEFFAGEELDLSKRFHALARKQKKRMVILHRNPLLTSARKTVLYKRGELGRFLLRAFTRPSATMKSREACSPWYDGRR